MAKGVTVIICMNAPMAVMNDSIKIKSIELEAGVRRSVSMPASVPVMPMKRLPVIVTMMLRKIEPRRETSPSLQAGAYAQLGMSPPLGHPSTPPSDSGLPPRVSSSAESRRRQNLADLRAQR